MHSTHNPENSFRSAMLDAGIITDDAIIADGKLQRVHVVGDKRGTKNAEYILHADGHPAGWFKNFKTGIVGKWTLSGERVSLSIAMRQQIKSAQLQRHAEEIERQSNVAKKAVSIWDRSTLVIQHPYLIRKHVQAHNLRQYKGALVVPIYNQNKQQVNLQFINADGSKRFLSGGKKKHCFSVVGKFNSGKPILICEGWATGASLHEHTGHFVIVALDAGNLEPVALVVRCMFPGEQIIIAGDNDLSGVGQTAARAAARAVSGKYIIPATPGHDWNDSLTMEVPRG